MGMASREATQFALSRTAGESGCRGRGGQKPRAAARGGRGSRSQMRHLLETSVEEELGPLRAPGSKGGSWLPWVACGGRENWGPFESQGPRAAPGLLWSGRFAVQTLLAVDPSARLCQEVVTASALAGVERILGRRGY